MRDDPLSLLVPAAKFQAQNSDVFPTLASLEYFIRTHKAELIEAGAMLAPVGRTLINPPKFTPLVLEIGKRIAAGRRYVHRSK